MGISKQLVDGFLGHGWYNDWQEIQREIEVERKRTKKMRNMYGKGNFTALLSFDMDFLERVNVAYERLLERISGGEDIAPDDISQFRDILTTALLITREEADAINYHYQTDIVLGVNSTLVGMTLKHAANLKRHLIELEKLLAKLKQERLETCAQAAINTSLDIIAALNLPLAVLSTITQLYVDEKLGPSRLSSGPAAASIVSNFGESLEKIDKIGDSTKLVARKSAKAAKIVGFYFNVQEVIKSHKNVAQAEKKMKAARNEYRILKSKIKKLKPIMNNLKNGWIQREKALEEMRGNTDMVRQGLKEMYQESKFKVR